jgi:CheY-like chemotaxis protein
MGLAPLRGTIHETIPRPLSQRVLVVEDDADCLEVLSELLETYGCLVSAACNGADAIRLARTMQPDVVVLDLTLPDCDACQLIQRLKADDAAVTVVVFSGARDRECAARAAGADWFVLKPDSETLQRVVGELQQQAR